MNSKLLVDQEERTFILVFERDEEVVQGLRRFANEQNLTAASFTAIGALRSAQLGWFDVEKSDYEKTAIDEQVEVLALVGNVAAHNDKPKIHAHIVVGKRDGTAHGGHLLEAHVRPTLEVRITETPQTLRRIHDPETNLALIDIGA